MSLPNTQEKAPDITTTTTTPSPDLEPDTLPNTNADAALSFLHQQSLSTIPPLTPTSEALLLHKIDLLILPPMYLIYTLQYLDKTLLNYANVMGLSETTHLSKSQFSNLALIFYIAYFALEFPHAYAMQRLPTAKYLSTMVFLWGIVVTATSACKNYTALVVTRTLLGCFESAVAPSLILMSSMWYTREEQPRRVGVWYLGTGTGTVVGSLVSFGFQHVYTQNEGSLYSWQIMFLSVGLLTCVVGLATFFLLPDSPMSMKSGRLTRVEKVWAVQRLRKNHTGIENKRFKREQVVECFVDPQTWLLVLIVTASSVPNGAVSSFQATVIKGFGYDSKTTALLSIPSGAVAIVAILCSTYLAGRFNMRGLQVILLLIPGGILGGSLMAFLPADNKAGKLIGNYLTNAIGSGLPLLYSWVAANYAGHTKKVTMNALLLMG